jgi:molybdopterin synthase sulfur carrier subunit
VIIQRDVHGVPAWLIKEYLLELGGTEDNPDCIAGEGWRAKVQPIDPFRLGSITIGRVHLEIEGDKESIEALIPPLEMKLMRGGG